MLHMQQTTKTINDYCLAYSLLIKTFIAIQNRFIMSEKLYVPVVLWAIEYNAH